MATGVAPPVATGRTCRPLASDFGPAALVEFADSEQGATRIVVVGHGGYTAMVAFSLGYPVSDRPTYDPDAIHWDGRGPIEGTTQSLPALADMPIPVEGQLAMAWELLGSHQS